MLPHKDQNLHDFWCGKQGITSKITQDLGLPKSFKIARLIAIFEKIMECLTNEIEFDPAMVENCGGN